MRPAYQPPLPHTDYVEIPPEVARLTQRETSRMLEQVHETRRLEINQFWTLCVHHPEQAERLCPGAPAIVQDLFLLARHPRQRFTPSDSESVCSVTARLLANGDVANAFAKERGRQSGADTAPANAFWSHPRIVGVKVVGNTQVLALRYQSVELDPGTLSPEHTESGETWYLEKQEFEGGPDEDCEVLYIYVYGTVDTEGDWSDYLLAPEPRHAFEADMWATENLALNGAISEREYHGRLLLSFPTSVGTLMAQLQSHRNRLDIAGQEPPEWRAIVAARTTGLRKREVALRRRIARFQTKLRNVKEQIEQVQTAALEEETGFSRGDTVRHRATGEEGTLEIRTINAPHFRLRNTYTDITDELRRGEWIRVD